MRATAMFAVPVTAHTKLTPPNSQCPEMYMYKQCPADARSQSEFCRHTGCYWQTLHTNITLLQYKQ